MNKVIRCRNKNNKKIWVLLILQVIMGVAPVLMLISFVWFKMYEKKVLAIVFIVLIFLCNMAYIFLGRQYNILNSGRRGEKLLYKAIKRFGNSNIIFCNLPVRYKRGRSELDALIISPKGMIIVEVKNHSGTIQGSWKDEKWQQRKHYKEKTTVQEMDNPIKQMRRQRDIVKSILNAAGEDVWIDTVLFFSNNNVKLRINTREDDIVCMGSEELLRFLNQYQGKMKFTREKMERCAKILSEASENK